jgi:hypothetical protein
LTLTSNAYAKQAGSDTEAFYPKKSIKAALIEFFKVLGLFSDKSLV